MTDQLDLFGGAAAEPDPEWTGLAKRVPPHVRFGTSSWTFEGWKGLVYRRRYASQKAFVQDSLEEYARFPLFGTVGLDRSYYAPVPPADLLRMREQVPEAFELVPKVFSEVTTWRFPRHPRYGARGGEFNPAFLEPRRFEEQVGGPMASGLGASLGPMILEIAPTAGELPSGRFEDQLHRFLDALGGRYRFAVELRDPELLTPRYFAVLRAHRASHCFNFWERMPPLSVQLERGALTAPFVVARLLIPPGRRYADQRARFAPFDRIVEAQPSMRDDVVSLVRRAAKHPITTYLLVNNKAEGSSPETVIALARRLATEPL